MPFVAPIRTWSTKHGWTDGLITLEDPGVSVWDEEVQCFISAPSDAPVAMLDLGEPYETSDGP
jgi:hypothetical protein